MRAWVLASDAGFLPALEERRRESALTLPVAIQHLVSKGFLRKAWNRSRSLEPVLEDGEESPAVPILGCVAAGSPIEAIEQGGESIAVPAQMMASRARALLQGRPAPSLDDVVALAAPVLRHRIALNYVARADGVKPDDVIAALVKEIA